MISGNERVVASKPLIVREHKRILHCFRLPSGAASGAHAPLLLRLLSGDCAFQAGVRAHAELPCGLRGVAIGLAGGSPFPTAPTAHLPPWKKKRVQVQASLQMHSRHAHWALLWRMGPSTLRHESKYLGFFGTSIGWVRFSLNDHDRDCQA